jgi:hypothetical protein
VSTFARWAIDEQQKLIDSCNGLLAEIRDGKAAVRDNAAMQILTNVQASLLGLRQHGGEILSHLRAAERNGEHRDVPVPFVDHKRAAAHDTDEPDYLLPP